MHIVIYSGGMDSFTLLHHVLKRAKPDQVRAVSFWYGQRHRKELDFARAECDRLGVRQEIIDLGPMADMMRGSALTSDNIPVPEGAYDAPSMTKTVVPGRNTVMLALALSYAEGLILRGSALKATIYYGAHAGDHAIYPDCRAVYVDAMARAIYLATEGRVDLKAPFLYESKLGILLSGKNLGLDAPDYARTWTCYKGEAEPCGVCGSCNERAEAFTQIGWVDPTAKETV